MVRRLYVALSVGTPLCPYGIAYRGVYGISTCELFKKSRCSPLHGLSATQDCTADLLICSPRIANSYEPPYVPTGLLVVGSTHLRAIQEIPLWSAVWTVNQTRLHGWPRHLFAPYVFTGVPTVGSMDCQLTNDSRNLFGVCRVDCRPRTSARLTRTTAPQYCEAVPGGLVFKARRLLYHSTLGRE